MSSAATAVPSYPPRTGMRWLLLGSLALNLFFIGVAIAMVIRAPAPPHWDPNVFVRIERLARTLPPADAAVLNKETQVNHDAIATAQDNYHAARAAIYETLRQDPFKVEDMRAAMTKSRAARQTYDVAIQGMLADAAAKMSPEGRHALADWHTNRKIKRNRH